MCSLGFRDQIKDFKDQIKDFSNQTMDFRDQIKDEEKEEWMLWSGDGHSSDSLAEKLL